MQIPWQFYRYIATELVCWYIPKELLRDYLEFWKKKQVDDVEVFWGDFTDGFKRESPYNDVIPFVNPGEQ